MSESVTIVGDAELRETLRQIGRQAPFALSMALNKVANEAQREIRRGVRARFTLRQPTYILNTIYRKPGEDFARKARLEAAVRVNEARDVLGKFEGGGIKRPAAGRSIAIPVQARTNRREIITTSNRPRAVLDRKGFRRAQDLIIRTVGRGRQATQQVWYLLKRSVRIEPKLGMWQASQRAANQYWRDAVESSIAAALSSRR